SRAAAAAAGPDMPTPPGDLRAVEITGTTIKISWSPSTAPDGIASYTVRVGESTWGTTTETSFTATGLNTGTEHLFDVVAVDDNGVESPASASITARTTGTIPAPPAKAVTMGVFPEDDEGPRNFEVKNLVTSGTAARLTHLTYASGKIQNGKCTFGDPYRALQRSVPAEHSVDGERDTFGQAVSGNINQLRKLKKLHPHLKILWSFGGSRYSAGFPQALKDPAAFAASCAYMINNRQWADVFDGIDLNWELPADCSVTGSCDSGGPAALRTLAQASRTALGDKLLTATIHGSVSRVFNSADYTGAARYLDLLNVKSYDYARPTSHRNTAMHSGLHGGAMWDVQTAHLTYLRLAGRGVHPNKIVFGVPSHARRWEGVSSPQPGSWATGPAYGTLGRGMESYRTVKTRCPGPHVDGGSAYSHCGTEWWSYDTPVSIAEKAAYTKQYGLGGAFLSDLRGDTDDGELVTAIANGLR
ncbi:glycosyl hydrolase family 18 protein, partial [Streptomyces sp. NPDC055078]